jgi:hypothetical protein
MGQIGSLFSAHTMHGGGWISRQLFLSAISLFY